MTKGIVYNIRQKFIKLMVDVLDASGMIKVYKQCFLGCKKDSSAKSGCLRMLRDATIFNAIDALRREKEELIHQTQLEEIQRLAREQIITQVQLEAVLSQIAIGQFRRKKTILRHRSKEW